jgi:hypothetical protein
MIVPTLGLREGRSGLEGARDWVRVMEWNGMEWRWGGKGGGWCKYGKGVRGVSEVRDQEKIHHKRSPTRRRQRTDKVE